MTEEERKAVEMRSIMKIAGVETPKKKQARKPKEDMK